MDSVHFSQFECHWFADWEQSWHISLSHTRTHTLWMTRLHFLWPSTLSFIIRETKNTITDPKRLLSVLTVNIYDWGFLVFLLLRRSLSVTVAPKSSSHCWDSALTLYSDSSQYVCLLHLVSITLSFVSKLTVDSFHGDFSPHLRHQRSIGALR